jgi:hypothetical protein
VDYDDIIEYVGDDAICTGYGVSRGALYRLISNKYGRHFFEALLIRSNQIMHYFNQYKINYKENYIVALQRTVSDLTHDMKTLIEKGRRDMIRSPASSDCLFDDNDSYDGDEALSLIQSDAILDNREYIDEISAIHRTLETTINRVDGRVSDIHLQLADIAMRIDDIVGSIVVADDQESVGAPEISYIDRQSTEIDDRASNPVSKHVRSIFLEYEKLSKSSGETYLDLLGQTRKALRNTCIGNEHSL